MKQLRIKANEIQSNAANVSEFLEENYKQEINNIAYVINNKIEKNFWDEIENGELEIKYASQVEDKILNKSIGLKVYKALRNKYGIKIINFDFDENEFILDFEIENNLTRENLDAVLENLKDIKLDSKDEIVGPIVNQVELIEITTLSGLHLEQTSNRIKGYTALNKKDLKVKKNYLEELAQRDHRKIGKELEIFTIDELAGKGLPIWLPNGVTLKRLIRDFIIEQENEYGYIQVETPVLGSLEFYKTSGHYAHYKNSMFPVMNIEKGEDFVLRPMACPHHATIFRSKKRSYKELPLRLAEQVKQFRYEASGALLGLERVRAMELTDSHIFLNFELLEEEMNNVLDLIISTLNKFDIKISYLELALHDPTDTEKYHGNKETWAKAEELLRQFLIKKGIKFEERIGEAAFYGPKIDIQIETALKHTITVSTLQLDFFLPERFDLKYIDRNGQEEHVIMLHRGLIGTYERFISVLLEQTKGVFPLWLAPVQVAIIPVNNEAHGDYAKQIDKLLRSNKIRTKLDLDEERLSYKIRKHQTNKVNIQIILGDDEVNENTITYRAYGEKESRTVSMKEFLELFS